MFPGMDDARMPISRPRVWNPRDIYQMYAASILQADPQCWGKYNSRARRKNYWIYKTVNVKGKATIVEVMNYKRWKRIMHAYFTAARNRMIFFGEGLSLGRLGLIKPRRIERNFSNLMVNWGETQKRPKIEKNGKLVYDFVYFDDPDYVMLGWRKYRSYTNEQMYEFEPSNGNRKVDGFKEQFVHANNENKTLKFLYEYIPMRVKTTNDGDISVL